MPNQFAPRADERAELLRKRAWAENNLVSNNDLTAQQKKAMLQYIQSIDFKLNGSFESTDDDVADSEQDEVSKKKSAIKWIIITVIILIVISVGINGINKVIEQKRQSVRADALAEEIKPIMNAYGLYSYTVKPESYAYDVYAEGFESLTKGEALALLTKLDMVSVDDPCGKKGKIDFGVMTHVHPGLDIRYSYWRVDSFTVMLNKQSGGNYKTAGIYCDRYGLDCIYEREN